MLYFFLLSYHFGTSARVAHCSGEPDFPGSSKQVLAFGSKFTNDADVSTTNKTSL